MGLSFLELPYQSIVTAYDDETTPIKLTGKKMLPIIVKDNGLAQNESLDILKDFDTQNKLKWEFYSLHKNEIDLLLDLISAPVHSMAMPYWIWTPEFNEQSRKYFQMKKEVKRGPFSVLVKNQQAYRNELNQVLDSKLKDKLHPFYQNSEMTIVDIMLASHLWGMYVVPEFRFDQGVHDYLMRVKNTTHFNYHSDYWL